MLPVAYAPPRDGLVLDADDERLVELADRLWARGAGTPWRGRPIGFRLAVRPGPSPPPVAERELVWEHGERVYTATIPGLLRTRIDLGDGTVEGEVSDGLLRDAPSLAARFLLEAPAAVLLSRRAFTVLHAGAVVGPGGAVVLRGAAGAGKSTLTAAAWKSGLGVLADESLLVARDDADDLVACVRDLTVRPDAAELLSIIPVTEVTFSGGEVKRRVDLLRDSTPGARRARRVATLLLGAREPGPARCVALAKPAFLAAFRAGEIPQERAGGEPDAVAERWSDGRSFRLDGAVDLAGAVALLRSLTA